MKFPKLATQQWVTETIDAALMRVLERYFADHDQFRQTDQTINTRLSLLVLQGQQIERRAAELERFGVELKALADYTHKNVHDFRDTITTLSMAIEHLETTLTSVLNNCPLNPLKASGAGLPICERPAGI